MQENTGPPEKAVNPLGRLHVFMRCFLIGLGAILLGFCFYDLSAPGASLYRHWSPVARFVAGASIWIGYVFSIRSLSGFRAHPSQSVIVVAACLVLPSAISITALISGRESLYSGRGKIVVMLAIAVAAITALGPRSVAAMAHRRSGLVKFAVPAFVLIMGDSALRLVFSVEMDLNHVVAYLQILNAFVAMCPYLLLVAVLGRVFSSQILASCVYLSFLAAQFLKIRAMHSPIVGADALLLSELQMVAADVVGWPVILGAILFAFVAIVATIICAKNESPLWFRARLAVALSAVSLSSAVYWSSDVKALKNWSPMQEWAQRGSFLHVLADYHKWKLPVSSPRGYSRDAVEKLFNELSSQKGAGREQDVPDEFPNVVFLLVESLIDLEDIGVQATPDPLLFFHELRRSRAKSWSVSANECSGSSTSEFELLTGLEAAMFGVHPIPYYRLGDVVGTLESVPSGLESIGYSVQIFQVCEREMYNRPVAYQKLGCYQVRWIGDTPESELDMTTAVGVSDPYVLGCDRLMVDEMLDVLSNSKVPVYAFGFTSGTHIPWSGDGSSIYSLSGDGRFNDDELQGFCCELAGFDRLLKTLWEGVQSLPRRTVLVVVGDHMPPLEGSLGPYGVSSGESSGNYGRAVDRLRRVPLIVLDNSSRICDVPVLVSHNMIPWLILDYLELPVLSVFDELGRSVLKETSVVSGDATIGGGELLERFRSVTYGRLFDAVVGQ